MSKPSRTEIFENAPVRRAVISQVVPAVISQMIALVYNLADTYFVGLLNDPSQTAAMTVVYAPFLMLTAISNLSGVGGASALSRSLGRKNPEEARVISGISVWFGLFTALLYSLVFLLFARPLLAITGAREDTFAPALGYINWVIVIGGAGMVMNMLLANLVRAEGSAAKASFGVSMGGILNIFLDPIFILPQFLGLGAKGAGIATALANLISALYLLHYILRSDSTVLSVNPVHLKQTSRFIKEILTVGFPSAVQYALTVVAVGAQAKFVSKYPTQAVAGLGITKKLDQLPLYFSIGVANGLMPLVAYNYSSGNVKRRRDCFWFGTSISIGFALLCVVLYECFAPVFVSLFIRDPQTVVYGAAFLRRMVLAMPMMAFCYPMIIQFQAMGKAREALICSVLRKGVLDIPFLFIMDSLMPLYGCMFVQPIVDTISLVVSLICYRRIAAKEKVNI